MLYLHKIGKYEIPADQILTALGIPHVHYFISSKTEIDSYLTQERKEWLFDHDQDFPDVMSQTTEYDITLYSAASAAQKELAMDLGILKQMERPVFLNERQWQGVLARAGMLLKSSRI